MTVDTRLAVPALLAWVGVGVLIGAPGLASAVALGAGAAGLLLLVAAACAPRGRTVWAMLALAALLLAGLAVAVLLGDGQRRPPTLVAAADAGRLVEIEGWITETWHGEQAPVLRLTVTAVSGTDGAGRVDGLSVPALLLRPDLGDERQGIGTAIALLAKVLPAEPGDDLAWTLAAQGEQQVQAPPPDPLAALDGLRAGFLAEARQLSSGGGALLPGLAIGDTGAVSEELEAAMNGASLSHLTAVSGANCAVVVGVVTVLAGAVGFGRLGRIVLAACALLGFVLLVTPEPSVLRAAVMATAALIALAAGRPGGGLPLLGAAVILLLLVDPWLARSYAFILSVAATGALLLLAGPLGARLARWMPAPLAAAIAVPLAAQLACQPVLILLEPTVPLYGVPANLVTAPAAPLATVVGLVACLVLAPLPWLGTLLLWIAWLPAEWIAAVARTVAGLPAARLTWPEGMAGASLLAVLTACALVVILTSTPRRERWWYRVNGIVLVGTVVALAGLVAGSELSQRLTRPHDWQVALCDVGQGDAVLLREGELTALVDTGPEPEPLAACLAELGVARLDLLVLTHFDLDHVGGAEALPRDVGVVLTGPPGEPGDEALLRRLAEQGAEVRQARRGDAGMLGRWSWKVHWPPRTGSPPPGNDASVVVEFLAGPTCAECLGVLLLGDLDEETQRRMAAGIPLSGADVVKVSHHGSADQHAGLYERVRAPVALIGVGENDYGHPAESLLETLRGTGAAVLRSDLDGLVVVRRSGEGFAVWRERARAGPVERPDEAGAPPAPEHNADVGTAP